LIADDAEIPDLAGVDGCRAGWVAWIRTAGSSAPDLRIYSRFADLVEDLGPDAVIAVDMPIGLPDRIEGPGRGPEQAIRPFLGARQSSVFSIPARAAVEAQSYSEACVRALETSDPPKKVSKQAFYLFPRILEIDRLVRADKGLSSRVVECHPEFSFCRLNNGLAMQTPKKIKGKVNPEGIAERSEILVRNGFGSETLKNGPPRGAGMDDVIDAAVNLVMAGRHAAGLTTAFPPHPVTDRYGIPIAIHG
jgi:predicted RNase H-like nuclease